MAHEDLLRIQSEHYIDAKREHYPFAIVWTPIPLLTYKKKISFLDFFLSYSLLFRWLIPIIGHLGIVTSEGLIHDFAGPYYVNVLRKKESHLLQC